MFLHMLKGIDNGARMVVVDPRRTLSVEAAHDWLPIRVGADIALANAMGHVDHRGGLAASVVHRPCHHGLRGVQAARRHLYAGVGRDDHRHPGAQIREIARAYARAETGHDLLDAGHHRAPQRRRQRAGPDQPGPAHREGGARGLRPQPAARPEQRAGRRRHGRAPRPPARLPARGERRAARQSSSAPGASPSRPARLAPVRHARAMERGDLRCLYVLGENPVQSRRRRPPCRGSSSRVWTSWWCRIS